MTTGKDFVAASLRGSGASSSLSVRASAVNQKEGAGVSPGIKFRASRSRNDPERAVLPALVFISGRVEDCRGFGIYLGWWDFAIGFNVFWYDPPTLAEVLRGRGDLWEPPAEAKTLSEGGQSFEASDDATKGGAS